jgi:hypothetical protein
MDSDREFRSDLRSRYTSQASAHRPMNLASPFLILGLKRAWLRFDREAYVLNYYAEDGSLEYLVRQPGEHRVNVPDEYQGRDGA